MKENTVNAITIAVVIGPRVSPESGATGFSILAVRMWDVAKGCQVGIPIEWIEFGYWAPQRCSKAKNMGTSVKPEASQL